MPDEQPVLPPPEPRKRLSLRDALVLVGLVALSAAVIFDIVLGVTSGQGMNMDHLNAILDGIIKLLTASNGGNN